MTAFFIGLYGFLMSSCVIAVSGREMSDFVSGLLSCFMLIWLFGGMATIVTFIDAIKESAKRG